MSRLAPKIEKLRGFRDSVHRWRGSMVCRLFIERKWTSVFRANGWLSGEIKNQNQNHKTIFFFYVIYTILYRENIYFINRKINDDFEMKRENCSFRIREGEHVAILARNHSSRYDLKE